MQEAKDRSRIRRGRRGALPARLALAILVLALFPASVVRAQILEPGTIQGTIDLTNTNPAVLAILADEGLTSGTLVATSIVDAGHPDVLTASTSFGPLLNAVLSQGYELTVESGPRYRVSLNAFMGPGHQYLFTVPAALPETPTGVPPRAEGSAIIDFQECVGVLDVRFVDEAGAPAALTGSLIHAFLDTDGDGQGNINFVQAQAPIVSGSTQIYLLVRGDELYTANVTMQTGSDIYSDLTRFECEVTTQVDCDEVVPIDCTVATVTGTGGLTGTLRGRVDMVGEEELDVLGLTFMKAFFGPFRNERWDHVTEAVDPACLGACGPFELENLVVSTATTPSQGYALLASMAFCDTDPDPLRACTDPQTYKTFGSPSLGQCCNPSWPVAAGDDPGNDLGDIFVMEPAYIRGEVLLAGPAEEACLGDLVLALDTNDDGIPEALGSYFAVSGWTVPAVGTDGLPEQYSTAGGGGRAQPEGAFSGSPADTFAGDYELIVGALNHESGIWKRPVFVHIAHDLATPEQPLTYQSLTIGIHNLNYPDHDTLDPGEVLIQDHKYCYGQIRVRFRVTGQDEALFFTPRFGSNNVVGEFQGTDFLGQAAHYLVGGIDARGTPNRIEDAASTGLVVACLPAGDYSNVPPLVSVINPSSGTSLTQLDSISFTVPCGGVAEFSTGLQCGLVLPACTEQQALPLSGSVQSVDGVVSASYSLNGGPEQACSFSSGVDCGDVQLEECQDSTITLTVQDTVGETCTQQSPVRFDGTAPAYAGCTDQSFTTDAGAPLPAADVVLPTATDNCDGPMPVVCDLPDELPVGTTTVTCTAGADDCGNQDDCSFLVTVTGSSCDDPDSRTQGYWHRQCMGGGFLSPGRSGRGPSDPLEPNFDKLEAEVSLRLQSAGLPVFFACSDGMDAQPASDPCQRATKQFTALLFNEESGRLTESCEVDVSAQGCSSTNVGDLLTEVANLIIAGNCQQAADCAEVVNAGFESESVALASTTTPDAAGAEPTANSAEPRSRRETALQILPARDTVTLSVRPADSTRPPVAILHGTQDVRLAENADADPERAEPAAAVDEDPLTVIEGHMAVLADPSATESALNVSIEALLTALSGGYDPEVRLQIVLELHGRIDVAYHGLLVEHLEEIRAEAKDFEKNNLAKQATLLLGQLESSLE